MPTPSLIHLPPATTAPYRFVANRPVTIGRDPSSKVRLEAPGIAPHHAVIERREGSWWLRAVDGPVQINGVALSQPARLRDRDQIRLGGYYLEFASGEKRTRRMESAADMLAPPRRRHYGPLPGPGRRISLSATAALVVAVALVVAGGLALWYGAFRANTGIAVLNDRQAGELDSLLSVSYDHIERGGTLLELGLGDGAAQEFAQAVNTLALSDLRTNPLVAPRIRALEASVASIYREQRLAVPSNYARATSPLSAEQLKTASLTVDAFAAQFQLMAAGFRDQFGRDIVVTGRDHAEHVALYGKGGAIDLSIKALSPAEVAFIIDQAHARHIRIKDFSRDSILQREVRAAVRAGLLFEAATGLHLHIDRFANRRDHWTTMRWPDSQQREQSVERGPIAGDLTERRGHPIGDPAGG
ncbi:MAG: FHA domain-containing protein [Gemmatimonadales bacterium]